MDNIDKHTKSIDFGAKTDFPIYNLEVLEILSNLKLDIWHASHFFNLFFIRLNIRGRLTFFLNNNFTVIITFTLPFSNSCSVFWVQCLHQNGSIPWTTLNHINI